MIQVKDKTKVKYEERVEWRRGFPSRGADAARVARELKTLARRLGHEPTSQEIYDAASNPKAELHRVVFWETDADAALRRERLHLCSDLGNAVKYVKYKIVGTTETEVGSRHVFVRTKYVDEGDHNGELRSMRLIPVSRARMIPKAKREMLLDAIRVMHNFRERFKDLAELSGVLREIDKLLAEYGAE